MTEKDPEYIDIEIELDNDQLEYIKQNNLDISQLAREWINELREKKEKVEAEKEFPKICYDQDHDILYVICKIAVAEAEGAAKGVYIRREMEYPYDVAGIIIEDFSKKLDEEARGMFGG